MSLGFIISLGIFLAIVSSLSEGAKTVFAVIFIIIAIPIFVAVFKMTPDGYTSTILDNIFGSIWRIFMIWIEVFKNMFA